MIDGFVKVGVTSCKINVCDVFGNAQRIIKSSQESLVQGVKLLVFPELCITGASCGDMFLQPSLQNKALEALEVIKDNTQTLDMVIVVGLPIAKLGKLYNCTVLLHRGNILGVVPKQNTLSQSRWFCEGWHENSDILINGLIFPFGGSLLFSCENLPQFTIGVEIGDDAYALPSVACHHAIAGATVIVNPCAVAEIADVSYKLLNEKKVVSSLLSVAYLVSSADSSESTTDCVYSGRKIITQLGEVLAEGEVFGKTLVASEIDVQDILAKRTNKPNACTSYRTVSFSLELKDTVLTKNLSSTPFECTDDINSLCENILKTQSAGLEKRILHTRSKSIVIGVSGGLDSTLALLVMARAVDNINMDRKNIIAVTMPCFGTTPRTKSNAEIIANQLGTTFKCVDIKDAVTLNFKDIGHDITVLNTTYENAQARERTQVLMGIAGTTNGFVVGTGDLSELCLGWATFNGDHMSMYSVNAGIPKTLIRSIVRYEAQRVQDALLSSSLLDVLDTPVSPELLPTIQGVQEQKTEDLVGPYELHDFFIYHALYNKFPPRKVYRLANLAFKETYRAETILKWLKVFYARFFSQQFKRNCLPDGVQVFDFSISPRGGLCMPSDATSNVWLQELDEL